MKKTIVVVLVVLVMVSGEVFAGCTAKVETSKIVLSVVVGKHANMKEIPLRADSFRKAIYECCYSHGSVSYVIADGDPNVYFKADIPEPGVAGLTENKKREIANEYTEQLLLAAEAASPEEPEVDTLKAIQQAAFVLQGNGDEAVDRQLLIMDSGLSTKSYLDFTEEDLLDADTADIVKALQEEEAIPQLQNVKVTWMFIAQTAAPQNELSEKQKKKLQNIWEEVLLAAGAESVVFSNDVATGENSETGLPKVSTVEAEERKTDFDGTETIAEAPLETMVLDSESLEFIGDTAFFVDEEKAYRTIEKVANQLIRHSENKVYIIGSTATGDKDFCETLSLERAKTVKQALFELGISEERMVAVGLGFNDPWHINDLDLNGQQIEELARQNRKVLIVDMNSPDAEKIK